MSNHIARESTLSQICLVTSHAFPESIGGEETFIHQLGRFLASRGTFFTVVSASSHCLPPRVISARVPPFSLPLIGFELHSSLYAIRAALKMLEIHRKRPLSLIYSVETGHVALAAIFVSKLLHVPLVVHSHIRRSELLQRIRLSRRDWRTWPYWALEKSIDRFVALQRAEFIAVSQDVANFLLSLGAKELNMHIIPSAIEVDEFGRWDKKEARTKLGIYTDDFVVAYLGRIEKGQKGIGVLLDAYNLFIQRSPGRSQLLIAGEGPDLMNLRKEARAEHLTGVRFLGVIADVAMFLCAIDLFVLPSFQEGRPIVLLEAMASGCAVVATEIPGVTEIAKGAAILVPPGDVSQLAEALTTLRNDFRLREKLSEMAIKASQEFSVDRVLPRIVEVCNAVIEKPSA